MIGIAAALPVELRIVFETLRRRPLLAVAASVAVTFGLLAAPPRVPENPATITIDVAPAAVSAGGQAEVTLKLEAKAGIKIARYPQIKLLVPAEQGLVAEAESRIGSSKPPPPDKLSTNYWSEVDPVTLTLVLDDAVAPGAYEIEAKLTYFFCVDGEFCAPARASVKIPLAVE